MSRSSLLCGLLLGVGLRWGYTLYAYHYLPERPVQKNEYETVALNLLRSGSFAIEPGVPTAHFEPLFPVWIAGVYLVTGESPLAFFLAQGLLGAMVPLMVLSLSRRLFPENPGVGAVAFWVSIVYPPFVYYGAGFWRETLLTFLCTALALLGSCLREPGRSREAVLAGVCAGALSLTNSAYLATGLALTASIAWAARPLRERLFYPAAYLFFLLTLAACWGLRNYAVFDRVIPGSTHGGEEFYQALVVPPDKLGTDEQRRLLSEDPVFLEIRHLDPVARNERLLRACGEFIRNHPLLYLSRVTAGWLKYWRLYPYRRPYEHSYPALLVVSLLTDGWIVPLGLWALWARRRLWAADPLVPTLVLGLSLFYAAVHAVIRYRVPLMGVMIVLAVGGAGELAARTAAWRRRA